MPTEPEQRGRPSNQHAGSYVDADELAQRLAEIARQLADAETGLDPTLQTIVASAVDTIPGARWASITEVRNRQEVSVRLANHTIAEQTDLAQYETGEGPCLTAAYEHITVRVDDLRTEGRWPEFSRRAVELGARSMLSVQLYVQHNDLGALNLYSDRVGVFDDESEHVGLLFATHAAVAMESAWQLSHLHQALLNRDLIGMAKGIIVERHKLGGDQAFEILRRLSNDLNVKLHEVARQVVETGSLTDVRAPRSGGVTDDHGAGDGLHR